MNETKATEPSRALMVTRQPTPELWQMVLAIADTAHKSRNLGVTSQAEAAMKILTGHELGLPPMASLRMIYIVKNKAAIQPKGTWGLIVGHPEYAGIVEEEIKDANGKFLGYAITLKRKNGMSARRQFTLEDATRAGLMTKDNWKSYPQNCCFWRAMGFAQDAVFPDVTMGLYRADEVGADITPDGEVVEGQWSTINTATPPSVDRAPTGPTLDQLVEKWGPDAVMNAAGGRIPGTVEEVAQVAAVLDGGNGN